MDGFAVVHNMDEDNDDEDDYAVILSDKEI